MSKTLVFAVDFDGCLVEFDFPRIGEQTEKQKELMKVLKELQKKVEDIEKNCDCLNK